MHLEVYDINSSYVLDFSLGLNYVTGKSSSGKTFLTLLLNRNKRVVTDANEILINPDYRLINIVEKNSIIIIDLDDTNNMATVKAISKCTRDDLCFIVLGRTMSKNLPISCSRTFIFQTIKGVTKNVRMYSKELYNPVSFSKVYVEDEKSGFKFFSNIFADVESTSGKENICKNIKENNLVVFDCVGFGAFLEEMLAIVNLQDCAYLGYKSFEGFILETVFGYTPGKAVINEEKYLEEELRRIKGGYSKSVGCSGEACNKCNKNCKMSSIEVLKKSKYSSLIKYYESNIKRYQRKYRLNKEELKDEILRLKDLFNVITLEDLNKEIVKLL